MADVSYSGEVQSILDLLRLRQPAGHLDLDKLPFAKIDPHNFAAAGCVRRVGRRQVSPTVKSTRITGGPNGSGLPSSTAGPVDCEKIGLKGPGLDQIIVFLVRL